MSYVHALVLPLRFPQGIAPGEGSDYNLLKLARANDEAGFKAGFASIGRSCGGCHEPFRAKQ